MDSIVAEHAQEASFLWFQRVAAVGSPALSIRSLARQDHRLAAHIDALRIAGDEGPQACETLLSVAEPGALFAVVILALEAKELQRIEALLSLAELKPPLQSALISAFGWVSARFLQGTAKALLSAASSFRRQVGIASCVMHGADPGQALSAAVTDADPSLRARALSAVGELGRTDLASICDRHVSDPDSVSCFGAASSAVLLGNRGVALEALTRLGLESGIARARGFRLMLQAMSLTASHSVLQRLGGDPTQFRWLIQGSGIAGDPKYVPWLVGQMANEKAARLAGEGFSLITGVDLSERGLEGKQPEELESGLNDDPNDPNVDIDPDEGLPWPDQEKVEKWWAANSSRFQKGTRYFMGAPVTREHCIDVLRNGYQRQRILAAHYLCLLEPGTPLFNTSAPAWRQQKRLAEMA